MAISKALQTTTLSIEVQNGVDKSGSPLYKKMNFSGVNRDATPDTLSTVADAISLVLANQTRHTLVNEIYVLENNA